MTVTVENFPRRHWIDSGRQSGRASLNAPANPHAMGWLILIVLIGIGLITLAYNLGKERDRDEVEKERDEINKDMRDKSERGTEEDHDR
jgi:hypothetical protein